MKKTMIVIMLVIIALIAVFLVTRVGAAVCRQYRIEQLMNELFID